MATVKARFGIKAKFSTLKVKRALEARGLWTAFKTAMTESALEDFMLASYLAVADEGFRGMLPGVQQFLNAANVDDTATLELLYSCITA